MSTLSLSEISKLTLVLWILFVIFTIARSAWKAYFHPLSQFPGPFLAKFTDAYSAYYSLRGKMHYDVLQCHKKYGHSIRYGPNRILTLCPQDLNGLIATFDAESEVNRALGIYGHGKQFKKAQSYGTMVPWPNGESTGTCIDKTMHKNLRRVVLSGLSTTSIKSFEPAILDRFDTYRKILIPTSITAGEWSQTHDMRLLNQCFAFDLMADFGFGVKTKLQEQPENQYVLDLLHFYARKLGLFDQWPGLNNSGFGTLAKRVLSITSSASQNFQKWHDVFIKESINKNKHNIQGVLGPIIQSGEGTLEKRGHSYPQMIAEGSFVTFTGSDGIGVSLSGLQYYLARHPRIYQKVSSEIRERFPPGEKIIWGPELASCAYLKACIEETWRMVPPACGVHWRESEKDDILVGDRRIPLGTDVGMSLYSLFRDETIFKDPLKFWPERWIEGELPQEQYQLARRMFAPFSIGPRSCSGSHVARVTVTMIIANLILDYEFALGDIALRTCPCGGSGGCEFKFDSHWTLPSWKKGPFIQFQRRMPTS